MVNRVCRKCGKAISRISFYNWAYKDSKGIYCSWHCFNHRKDEKPEKETRWHGIEVYDKDGNLIRTFTSASNAAEHTGFCIKKIRKACHDGTAYNGFVWKYKG